MKRRFRVTVLGNSGKPIDEHWIDAKQPEWVVEWAHERFGLFKLRLQEFADCDACGGSGHKPVGEERDISKWS